MNEEGKLQAIKCTACGGELGKSSVYDDEEEETIPVARCLSCGAEYDQETDLYYKLYADELTADADNSIFKLGMKGTLDGTEYEIIGRIRYQEEEEYEKATWDEWLAVSAEGNYHYFVEEEGEIYSYSDYIPETIDMEGDPIQFEGRSVSREEGYVARIVLAQGELTWEPEIGEPVTCYDIKHKGDKYTIEQSENEVTITKGDKITYGEIIEAFGLDEYRDAYNDTMSTRKSYSKKAVIYLVAALVSLGLGVNSCSSEKKVPGITSSKKILTSNSPSVENQRRVYTSQVLYGPFTIPKDNQLYDMNIRVNQSIQSFRLQWQSFRLMLVEEGRLLKAVERPDDPVMLKKVFTEIDSRKEPLESYMLRGDFWDEEGRDSEGYWHESDLSVNKSFVLDKKGTYYAYLELYSNRMRRIESVDVTMEQTGSVRYYIFAMVIFILLGLVNRAKSSSHNDLPFEIN